MNCPVCASTIHPDSLTVWVCPSCDLPHHQDCWNYNRRHCAIYGCQGDNPPPRPFVERPRRNLAPVLWAAAAIGFMIAVALIA